MVGRLVRLAAVAVLALAAVVGGMGRAVAQADGVELLLFWGNGCPHCEAEQAWLVGLADRHPELVVRQYEVWYDAANRARYAKVAAEHGVDPIGVPGTFVGDLAWIGFDDATAQEIERAVEELALGEEPVAVERTVVDVPLVGPVDLGDSSLLVATLVIGFVDGVNPCSLWVLTMLLALVLHSGSRRRVLSVGGMFLFVTAAMYALYVVGMFSVLSYVGYLDWIQRGVAVVVTVLGVMQVKDYVRFHEGPSLGIGDEAKPGIFRRMRGLGEQDRTLPAVLVATAGLAVGVSLMETPCTVGLPMMWTSLLAKQEVALAGASLLFALYMLVFLLDELVVFGVAVGTMRAAKLQERHGRELKLVSGVVMLTLAGVMLFAPQLMEDVVGALAVFVAAALLVTAVLLVGRARDRRTTVRGAARTGGARTRPG